MPATLGYYKLRGLAHYIRFLLEYTGEEYTEKMYKVGSAPDYDRTEWMDEKYKLGLDFPNLPYYIDGDVKITQSAAILKYIARKHNLIANKTEDEIIKSDMLENEAADLRMNFSRICYNPDFEKVKVDFIEKVLPSKLEQHSKFLGNNKWFFGDRITYVDFFFYESYHCVRALTPSTFDKFDSLVQFMSRFEDLEPIKKYMKSDGFITYPYNGPMATFGGK